MKRVMRSQDGTRKNFAFTKLDAGEIRRIKKLAFAVETDSMGGYVGNVVDRTPHKKVVKKG